ncbi:hypothetical protein GOBAR_DD34047 [Gossypium barbadense]|nr:hypothetical protein GOBAR_DD34047 [Gossypium barbadense]
MLCGRAREKWRLQHEALNGRLRLFNWRKKKLVAEIKKTAKTGNEASLILDWFEEMSCSSQMAPAKQAKVIKEFQKQSAQMDMTIEMMSEAIDETLDKDEAEEETEELTNQVLDEIGVDIASQLSSAPKGRIASKNAAPLVNVKSEPTTDVDDLEKRLASLRRL